MSSALVESVAAHYEMLFDGFGSDATFETADGFHSWPVKVFIRNLPAEYLIGAYEQSTLFCIVRKSDFPNNAVPEKLDRLAFEDHRWAIDEVRPLIVQGRTLGWRLLIRGD